MWRPTIPFLVDENAPRAVEAFLEERGHAVTVSREEIKAGSPDWQLALYAHWHGMVVVTWNHKHFRSLISRKPQGAPGDPRIMYARASRLSFRCSEVDGAKRLQQCIDLLECEWVLAQERDDMRVIAEIDSEALTFR